MKPAAADRAAEGTPSVEDLRHVARGLGIELSPERLEAALPEVRSLREQARRLRTLLADPEPESPPEP